MSETLDAKIKQKNWLVNLIFVISCYKPYAISWKSKGLYTSELKPLYTAFLHNVKLFGFWTWNGNKI